MKGLMLHCGAVGMDRAQLATLPIPQPQGPRHAIRPFDEEVEQITEAIQHIGGVLKDEGFGVLFDGAMPRRFFGVMEIALPGADGEDYGLLIAMRGSYDQSISRMLGVGSRVFCCDNLSLSAEIKVATKQTLNISKRMPQLLANAVGRIPEVAQLQADRFARYKDQALSKRQGDALLVELVRRGALNPSQLGVAIREWDEPSYAEHTELGWSVWRLHNAVTQAIKPSNPERAAIPSMWDRTTLMTTALDEVLPGHHDLRLAA